MRMRVRVRVPMPRVRGRRELREPHRLGAREGRPAERAGRRARNTRVIMISIYLSLSLGMVRDPLSLSRNR